MTDPSANPVEDLARELWETHVSQQGERPPETAWSALDTATHNHWRMLARVALTFAKAQR